ncbi:SAM-dependent methyltransferase [Thermoactinospora rubra]|uniref:SAM-dependent methyltransferase n=1 Tax=Thermoactinospora rubra TaxID=1088767 RepID=UPI001F0B07FB|nr:SAM-dependent methyltransferase [Thermoactinospora rubra]
MSQLIPEGVDPSIPNVARMYDYYLGGKDNFEADRAAADQVLKLFPETRSAALENREFLRRAVRYLVEAGVDQIVDLGSGLPTQGNTHEIAPQARVVYVDYDAVVCAHARALLAGSNVAVLQADVRQPDRLLEDLRELVDLRRPVAFLMLAILHFIPDEPEEGAGAYEIVARLREAGVAGSHLVVSHAIDARPDTTPEALEIYRHATASLSLRTKEEIARFFDGYTLVEPGLVYPKDWRPDTPPERESSVGYAGVGVKR